MAGKAVTMRDIARRVGVSAYTVSLAMRGSGEISQATRDRVLEVAQELGYRQDPLLSAAMARMRKTDDRAQQGALGLVISGTRQMMDASPKYKALLRGARGQASHYGFALDLMLPDEEYRGKRRRMAAIIRERGLPGVILCAVETTFEAFDQGEAPIDTLLSDLPMVLVGFLSGSSHPHWHLGQDWLWEMTEVVRRAVERGYERPGLIWSSTKPGLLQEHVEGGFTNIVRELLGTSRGVPAHLADRQFSGLREWLEKYRPDCVICDDRAAYDALVELDWRIPEEIGFVSMNAHPAYPDHTCMMANWEEIGRLAVSTVMASMQRQAVGLPSLPGRMLLRGDWCEGNTLPKRYPRIVRSNSEMPSHFEPLDLTHLINQPVSGEPAWFGLHPLEGLSPGEFLGSGIPHQIAPFKQQTAGCLLFCSAKQRTNQRGERLPEQIEIPIDRELLALWVLHACGHSRPGETFAHYRLHFGEGAIRDVAVVALGRSEFPQGSKPYRQLRRHANIQDWWRTYEPLVKKGVRPVPMNSPLNPDYLRRLYRLEIDLGARRHVRSKLEIRSKPTATSTLAVLAVTLELPSLPAAR